jgi:sigma-B regulation protein RsbU (phosphoserine phosphatase)
MGTGLGVETPFWWFVAGVAGLFVVLQVIWTLRGFRYARSISTSVAKLDRGVRAVREGDFGYRILPRERDQLGTLALAFNGMSEQLQSLLEERVTHQAMERELAIARDVQARLFPERMPYAPFLEASAICLPARTVSGDYYDFMDIGAGYDAVVADVSGKGISAALVMASLQAALRSLYVRDGRSAPPDPALVLTHLNRQLHASMEPARFVTLFLVRYRGGGKLEYCNAGHNPAALVRGAQVEWLSSGGLLLGPFPDLVYESASVSVQPGDLLCLYTDGVTEAESPTGEHFGEERLAQALCDTAGRPAREVQAAVLERVQAWRAGREAGDDVTLVLLRITG